MTLEHVEKTLGRKPKELAEAPAFPTCIAYVWDWYCALSPRERLTYTELDSWSRVTKTPLAGWEADLIMSIDKTRWLICDQANSCEVKHVRH